MEMLGLTGAWGDWHGSGEIPGLNSGEPLDLGALSAAEACGIRGVAVKCIDIAQNPACEGSVPCGN